MSRATRRRRSWRIRRSTPPPSMDRFARRRTRRRSSATGAPTRWTRRIPSRREYAVKAMLDLALCDDGRTLQPIQDIAGRQDIPQRYLEQVLLGLKRAGFLHSRRGSAGGYRLARPPQQITVGALLRAVEGH